MRLLSATARGFVYGLLLVGCLSLADLTNAEPRFARIFSDYAVLQRDQLVPVWGFGANPAQKLEVRFGDWQATAKVSRRGEWYVQLPRQPANPTGRKLQLIVDGQTVAEITDVVVGEVWLAAGQSNMGFTVRQIAKKLPEAKTFIESSRHPLVRMRRINDPVLEDREAKASDLQPGGFWSPMTPLSVVNFSAVAAVYAREVFAELDVPIGIIDVSWGGKPIEPFIPREWYRGRVLEKILRLADADALEELAKLSGGVIIRNPQGHPGAIFNARMFPVSTYGLRGFIWYQAESNCGKGEDPREYRYKQARMIEAWRRIWVQGSSSDPRLPFYYVQLPSFPDATGWIRMREEQRLALSVADTAMAVTIDVRGEGIHPPDKLSVGRRLAALALSKTYGKLSDDVQGPMYAGHRLVNGVVRVQFKNAASGLMVGEKTGVKRAMKSAGELQWFELADATGSWYPAKARIDGREVVVSAAGLTKPVAVRYACHVQPQGGNLYNRAGYPASPFCSDLKLLPWDDHGVER